MRPDPIELLEQSTRGGTSGEELRFLRDLASHATAPIVEIGTAQGRSAIALALGSIAGRGVRVYAVDPHVEFLGVLGGKFGPWDRTEAFFNFLRFGVSEMINVVNLPASQVSKGWTFLIGLLWIDGDHRLESVRADYENWHQHIVKGGWLVFDDATIPNLGPDIVANEAAQSNFKEIPAPGKIRAFQKL